MTNSLLEEKSPKQVIKPTKPQLSAQDHLKYLCLETPRTSNLNYYQNLPSHANSNLLNGRGATTSDQEGKTSYFRKSVIEDVFDLATRICPQDKEEIWRANGSKPVDSLCAGFYASDEVYTIVHNGVIKSMFGVNKSIINDRIGIPWLLSDGQFEGIEIKFLRTGKKWVDGLLSTNWDLLYNYVDVDNHNAIKWLKFLGFSFIRVIPNFGYAGTPFVEFMRIKNV